MEPQYTKHTRGLEKVEKTRSFTIESEGKTRNNFLDAFKFRLNREGKYKPQTDISMKIIFKGMGNHELNKLWLECDEASSFTSKFWSIMKA